MSPIIKVGDKFYLVADKDAKASRVKLEPLPKRTALDWLSLMAIRFGRRNIKKLLDVKQITDQPIRRNTYVKQTRSSW